MRTCILAGLVVSIVAPAAPAADPPRESLACRTRAAIDKGVEFLRREARGRGHWEGSTSQVGIAAARPGGVTALALLALLDCGVKPDDPLIQRGLGYLRKIEPQNTYVVGLQTMVLAEVGDPKDVSLIERNVDWLTRTRVFRDRKLHGWGYGQDGTNTDFSNSHYAVLGLYAGRRAGVKIDRSVWESIQAFYTETQQRDGGWVYSFDYGNHGSSLTMTTAGLCALTIAGEALEDGRRKVNPDGTYFDCGKYPADEAVRKALAWLGDASGGLFRFTDPGHTFYNVYGIERAGRLTGRRLIAGHDWYREGCEFLVGLQHEDGSWYQSGGADGAVDIATSFALLFLSKGRTPILISKFAHGPGEDWNNKHHDARHLAEFASKELFKRQPLAWQVYDARMLSVASRDALRSHVDDLLRSPVLFMNGHQPPELTPVQKQALREYLDRGGFLFAEACCGRKEFADGFRALMKELFPETDLTPLRPDHPIWTAHFAVRPDFVRLEGIEQGCKTVVVFSPQPLAGDWDMNRWTPRSTKEDVPLTDRGTQAFRLAGNAIAYATGLSLPGPPPARRKDDRPRPVADRVKVAQVFHAADWHATSRAMPTLMRYLAAEWNLSTPIAVDNVRLNDPDLSRYNVLYMHGRTAFAVPRDHADNLRAHLTTGGLLLADAGCGKAEFDTSFRAFAAKLFPDAELEPIPPDDPVFGADVNGTPITTVRLRKEWPGGKAGAEFRDTRPTDLEGIRVNGRWAVVYSRYDLGCALQGQVSGKCQGYDHDSALRLASAVVSYALTSAR